MTPEDLRVGLEDVVLGVERTPRKVEVPRPQPGQTSSWGPDQTHSRRIKQTAVSNNPRTASPQGERLEALPGKQQLLGKMHNCNQGDHQHTPYARRSRRKETGTTLALEAFRSEMLSKSQEKHK